MMIGGGRNPLGRGPYYEGVLNGMVDVVTKKRADQSW